MCFILEHEEPVLVLAIDIHRDPYAAGIDLLRGIEIVQFPLRTQHLHPDHSEIHQRHVAFLPRIESLAVVGVFLIRFHDRQGEQAVLYIHRINCRGKRRVTTVIRPVGINHTQFCDRRRAVFSIAEIFLHKDKIFLAHGKSMCRVKALELDAGHLRKLRQRLYIPRHGNPHLERRWCFKGRLTALHAIDEISLDLFKDEVTDLADQHDNARCAHIGALPLRHELYALRCRSRRRVKLPRQRLNGKDPRIGESGQCILIDSVDRRIGKDNIPYLFKLLVAQALHIIARNHAYCAQVGQTERLHKITAKALCRNVEKALPLLDEDSLDGHKNLPSSMLSTFLF